MAEVTVDKVPQKVRDAFNKGFTAFERGNIDYAIDLLFSCVVAEPSFLQARKYLHAAEIQRLKKKGINGLTHHLAMLSGIPLYIGVLLGMSKSPAKALLNAEKLMKIDPLQLQFIQAYAQAAEAAGLPEAAVQKLETAREHYAQNVSVLVALGDAYQKMGKTKDARDCFEKLCELKPNDPAYIRLLKNAMALDSMQTDGWVEVAEKGGSFREIVKDAKEAVLLEQKDKAFKSDKDMDALIADLEEKIKKEPRNVNYYRALSRYYCQKYMFPEAISVMEKAKAVSTGDPEIDNQLSSIRVQEFDFGINRLKEAGDTVAANARTMERDQFVFDDLQERVKRYPNDFRLRYELGVILFNNDYFNEAIQQFQLAQRNPKHRIRALYYLGLCFEKKEQYDMAVEQLEMANADSPLMDDLKKDILYALGSTVEKSGDRAKALVYYKQIYQADISYRDVATKIEQLYKQ